MSRAQQTSTVEQNTGGAISPVVAGKNTVANGAYDYWQRGISFTGTSPYYGADRWQFFRWTATNGATWSRISPSLNGFNYAVRAQRTAGDTQTLGINIATSYETAFIPTLWGQNLVFSFWARAGANYSSSIGSNILQAIFTTGTGTDGSLGGGFTGGNNFQTTNVTLTSSWVKYTIPITTQLTSSNTQFGFHFEQDPTGTAGANDYYDITGVQLEIGSVATPFSRAGGTLQGELALCQRYLPALIGPNQSIVSLATGTTSTFVTIKMPVTARVAPTGITIPSLSLFNVFNGSLSTANPTAISFDSSGTDYVTIAVTTSAGSPTIAAGQADLFRLNSTGAYILFTGCEL